MSPEPDSGKRLTIQELIAAARCTPVSDAQVQALKARLAEEDRAFEAQKRGADRREFLDRTYRL